MGALAGLTKAGRASQGFGLGGALGGDNSARLNKEARAALSKEISGQAGITDLTKSELVKGLRSGQTVESVRSTLGEAKAGTSPKFKSRQFFKSQRELQQDRPGRRQTLLSR